MLHTEMRYFKIYPRWSTVLEMAWEISMKNGSVEAKGRVVRQARIFSSVGWACSVPPPFRSCLAVSLGE